MRICKIFSTFAAETPCVNLRTNLKSMPKTILLLGGYGFLGTNVMKYVDAHLKGMYQFIVFDKFDHHLGGVKFENVVKTYAGDFTNKDLLEQIFNENKIDIVLHSLSTTVPVDSSNARFDVESNLIPTLDVLGLMVKYQVRDIVYLSSGGAIYGTQSNRPHKETDEVCPVSSYGVVKLAIEKYMMQYAQLYGIRPLILRLSNPYGPYHYSMKQGVVNIAMTRALRGESMEIWGDGEGKKDYIYVEDYVDILFQLIEKQVYNEIINVASGQILSVNNIVDAVRKYVRDFHVEYADAAQFDVSRFELDTSKLHTYIGKYNFTSIEEGLEKTFAWTKQICSN